MIPEPPEHLVQRALQEMWSDMARAAAARKRRLRHPRDADALVRERAEHLDRLTHAQRVEFFREHMGDKWEVGARAYDAARHRRRRATRTS